MLIQKLQQKLLERAENNSLRKLTVSKGMVDFFSNDYLGLAANPELSALVHEECEKVQEKPNGSTGSRLLSGNTNYALKIEEELATLFRAEKTLLMNSGYNANLSILSAIPQKGDTIIYDELVHASLKDGYRLSFASRFPFRHNDLEDLEAKLKKGKGDLFVVVESVYSMDGDAAPLEKIVALCEQHNANLIVDEAHSTGIMGAAGNGMACALELEQKIFARIYTFGKGMGIHGACIAGSRVLIEYLINYARPFIYTTSLPLHSLASIRKAFDYVKEHPELAQRLAEKINYFKQNLPEKIIASTNYIESNSAIQVIMIPGNSEVKKLAAALQARKLDIRPILSPTVREGEERLRICLHEYNTTAELDLLHQSLNEFL
ncbi:MAG TPA: 8-amino-7-oxononanoate synthase [Cytophagaceae bacterium]|nr:8-amino-7-oxononanoate synthase [Cytophagaceae bacterium]